MNNNKDYNVSVIHTTCQFLFITLICMLSISCSSRKQQIQESSWVIHMPRQWKLYERGDKKGPITYAIYTRSSVSDNDGTIVTPTCIISNERRSAHTSLASSAVNRQTNIIESLQRRGYVVGSFRKDIQHELKSAFRINDIVCLAYEYSPANNNRRYLLISVYALNKYNLLNISFESSPTSYPSIRKELYQIISSIR